MTKINVARELTLGGSPLIKVATNKNPYFKNPDKTIATVKYVNETLKDFKPTNTGVGYNADLARQFDTLIIGDDDKDIVFGLKVVKTDTNKFYYTGVNDGYLIEPQNTYLFSDGIYGIYLASKAIFPDGTLRTFKQRTDVSDDYDFYWKPSIAPTIILSPVFKDIRIHFKEDDTQTKSTLIYSSCSLLSNRELSYGFDFKNITVVVDNINWTDVPKSETNSVIPYVTILRLSKKYFEGIDLTELADPNSNYVIDLSRLSHLTSLEVELNTTNYDIVTLENNIRRLFNLYGSKYTITFIDV